MGMVHIYCGDGKGKTSAALGLALRAAGSGLQVLIVRFLKNDRSGEVEALKQVKGIALVPCRREFGFFWNMTEAEKGEAREYYGALFEEAWKKACGGYDVLVLDEIMAAASHGLVDRERLLKALDARPEGLEVVMTGRDPGEDLLSRADYITRMECIRHPYEKGVSARRGIEY